MFDRSFATRMVRIALGWAGVLALVTGCGGSGGGDVTTSAATTSAVSGVALDGYLVNARAFYDVNDNGEFDNGEPSAMTNATGQYTLAVSPSDLGRHWVIVMVIPGVTLDSDNPGTPITTGYKLASTPDHPEIVSPMTSLIAAAMGANPGLTSAQAEQQLRLALGMNGNSASLFRNFGARSSGDADLNMLANWAKVIRAEIQAAITANPAMNTLDLITLVASTMRTQMANGQLDPTRINVPTAFDDKTAQGLVGTATTNGNTYTVAGKASGLVGTLVLQNNGGDNLTITSNDAFTFNTALAYNRTYNVTVLTQPTGQTCSVSNGSGSVWGNVVNVAVVCSSNTYSVGGTVSGLAGTLVLQNNGTDNLTVSGNGTFTFGPRIAAGSPYRVTVLTQPNGQTCSVSTESGTVTSAVVNVMVTCASNSYRIGGSVSGLTGSLVLQNNGTDNLTVNANGAFAFAARIASGSAYTVSVLTQPAGQTCTLSGASGTVGGDVSNVAVSCSATPPACTGGTTLCGGTCVNTQTSAANCGVCGNQCSSGVCGAGACQAASCSDGVKNGAETAVDCGGGTCGACGAGKGCAAGSDCSSGVCSAGVCQTAACSDSVKNGAETDVDCGGGTCAACAVGKACSAASDCTSNVCFGGVCQAATCTDAVKNGAETGVDCGGGSCPLCATGLGCNTGSDCSSGVCSGHVCQAATCTDAVRNGTETDVDCGGTCGKCAANKLCAVNADCISGTCSAGLCN